MFIVHLRYTSTLAVKIFPRQHRFWIDFGGNKIGAHPHQYYFDDKTWAEDVNFNGLGRNRDVLIALVPRAGENTRVPVWLHVTGPTGKIAHNLRLGYFYYDDLGGPTSGTLMIVPLKTYPENIMVGLELRDFLEGSRPPDEDVQVPTRFIESEICISMFVVMLI
jgi:hypothetical protein